MTPADTIQRQKLAISILVSTLRGFIKQHPLDAEAIEREIAAAEAVTKGESDEEGRAG